MKQLSFFHNWCIITILGVTEYKQWKDRISPKRLACEFAISKMAWMPWWTPWQNLMGEERLPKIFLFGARKEETIPSDQEEVAL